MAAKFVMYQDKAKKTRFRLLAANGEIIAQGEAYESKAACLKGIKSIQKNAPTAIIDDETVKKEPAKKPAAKKPAAKKAPAKKPVAPKEPVAPPKEPAEQKPLL